MSAVDGIARRTARRLRPLAWCLWKWIAVAPTVTIGRDVHVGLGTRVWAPRALSVGSRVYIGRFCSIECDGSIGAGTMIANNVGIIGRCDHDFRKVGVALRDAPWVGDRDACAADRVEIGEDVWIGFGATVLSGTRIGRGAIVGAGSVIVDDVPAYAVVVGNPAHVVRARFSESEILIHERTLDLDAPDAALGEGRGVDEAFASEHERGHVQ